MNKQNLQNEHSHEHTHQKYQNKNKYYQQHPKNDWKEIKTIKSTKTIYYENQKPIKTINKKLYILKPQIIEDNQNLKNISKHENVETIKTVKTIKIVESIKNVESNKIMKDSKTICLSIINYKKRRQSQQSHQNL